MVGSAEVSTIEPARLIAFVIAQHVASSRVLERRGISVECHPRAWGVDLVRDGLPADTFLARGASR